MYIYIYIYVYIYIYIYIYISGAVYAVLEFQAILLLYNSEY